MIKLIFGLAFVSMVLGKEYPGFDSFGSEKYFISKDKGNFGGAWSGCQVKGLTLAREQNDADTKALNDFLVKAKSAEKAFYIGGYEYESGSDPTWIWLQTGDVIKYNNWVAKEPQSAKHCVVKTTDGKVLGKWKEAGCLEEHPYICQAK